MNDSATSRAATRAPLPASRWMLCPHRSPGRGTPDRQPAGAARRTPGYSPGPGSDQNRRAATPVHAAAQAFRSARVSGRLTPPCSHARRAMGIQANVGSFRDGACRNHKGARFTRPAGRATCQLSWVLRTSCIRSWPPHPAVPTAARLRALQVMKPRLLPSPGGPAGGSQPVPACIRSAWRAPVQISGKDRWVQHPAQGRERRGKQWRRTSSCSNITRLRPG
jgi:hypothetical protein